MQGGLKNQAEPSRPPETPDLLGDQQSPSPIDLAQGFYEAGLRSRRSPKARQVPAKAFTVLVLCEIYAGVSALGQLWPLPSQALLLWDESSAWISPPCVWASWWWHTIPLLPNGTRSTRVNLSTHILAPNCYFFYFNCWLFQQKYTHFGTKLLFLYFNWWLLQQKYHTVLLQQQQKSYCAVSRQTSECPKHTQKNPNTVFWYQIFLRTNKGGKRKRRGYLAILFKRFCDELAELCGYLVEVCYKPQEICLKVRENVQK